MARRPRTDADALRRAWRARPSLLVVLVLLALVAAVYSWVRPQGTGRAEDPARVLVVAEPGEPETDPDAVERVVRVSGFEARIVDRPGLEALGRELRYDVDDLDEAGRLELALELADELGYGFLAWSAPDPEVLAEVSLGGDVPGELRHWVVLSVGDLAFPHEATFEPPPSDVVTLHGVGMLRALYAQSRFAADREMLTHRPSVEELNLQRRIDPGQSLVNRVERLEATAGQIEKDIARLLNEEGQARPLGEPMQSGIAVPLADGDAMAVVRDVGIVSTDGSTLGYEPADAIRLVRLGLAGDGAVENRTPCTRLTGDAQGRVAVEAFPELVASVGGGAVVWRTAKGGTRVYLVESPSAAQGAEAMDGAPEASGCGLRLRGTLPDLGAGETAIGVPSEAGEVVRVRHEFEDGRELAVLDLLSPRSEAPAERVELGRIGGVRMGAPVWMGDSMVAVAARADSPSESDDGSEPDDAVYLFSTLHPGVALHVSLRELYREQPLRLQALAAIGGPDAGLVLTAGRDPTVLARLDWGIAVSDRFDELSAQRGVDKAPVGEADGVRVEPAGVAVDRGTLRALLMPGEAELSVLMRAGEVYEPQVSPDGGTVAFAWDGSAKSGARGTNARRRPARHDIAVLDLEAARAGESVARRVSQGAVEDRKPGWSADGQLLVFESIVQVSVTGHQIGAPRVVAVDGELARR